MQSRNVTEQAVVIMEVSVLVKPFCARIYGWVTEKALKHSLPLTAASAYSPDRLLRRDAGVSWRVPQFWFFHGNFTAIPLVYPKQAPL